MRLSIGYSDSEDRLWIRSETTHTLWWVSRRLALRLIGHWARLMERTLKDEGAPATEGRSQDDEERVEHRHGAVREEHLRALAVLRDRKVEPVGRPPPGVELDNRLLASAELSAGKRGVRIVLKSAGHEETLAMSRDEAHRMLYGLFRRCSRIGWYGAKPPAWLAEELPSPAGAEPDGPPG